MFRQWFKYSGYLSVFLMISAVIFSGVASAEDVTPAPAGEMAAVATETAPDPDIQAMSKADIVMLSMEALRLNRQYVVASAMRLSEVEGKAFWPVYEEYWKEMGESRDKLIKLVEDFGKTYATMTEAQANALISDYLQLRQDEFTIKQKYVEKFKAALPAVKVARYYQIENKLDSIIAYEGAKRIPLVATPGDEIQKA